MLPSLKYSYRKPLSLKSTDFLTICGTDWFLILFWKLINCKLKVICFCPTYYLGFIGYHIKYIIYNINGLVTINSKTYVLGILLLKSRQIFKSLLPILKLHFWQDYCSSIPMISIIASKFYISPHPDFQTQLLFHFEQLFLSCHMI